MASLSSLRDSIKTKLDTLTSVQSVHDYLKLDREWFPVVMFEPDLVESNYLDSCNNQRNYVFDIYLMQEMEHRTREQALEALIPIFDEILNLFDDDYTLWGLCDWWIEAVGGNFEAFETHNWPVLSCVIRLTCKTLYNIT